MAAAHPLETTGAWELPGFQVTSGTNAIATAAAKLRDSNGDEVQDVC